MWNYFIEEKNRFLQLNSFVCSYGSELWLSFVFVGYSYYYAMYCLVSNEFLILNFCGQIERKEEIKRKK